MIPQALLQPLTNTWTWLDRRLNLTNLWSHTAGHHIPPSSASWAYVFGSATLLCFMIQLVTGICLALVYIPSGAEAYTTLQYLTYEQDLGWFLRAMHYWGSNFMVGIMLIHMMQVFLWGAFKYPRELTWISGCFLLILVLGMAFTGQVLRFDEDSYWGLGIGAAIMGRVPIMGDQLVNLMLGGPIIAGETLSRFFTLHVFVMPGIIIGLIAMHLRLVLAKGVNEYPVPGALVDRNTYDAQYENHIKKHGIPFFPDGIGKDLVFAFIVISGIMLASIVFGPKGPTGPPDPTQIDTLPRPDFYFLWIFAVAALLPDWMETFLLLTAAPVGIGFLLALPFLCGEGEKSWRRRPVSVVALTFIVLALGVLTYLGQTSPWSPVMDGWTSAASEPQYIKGRTPLELQGALVLQQKQCRNCHAIDGIGGERGPDLADVGTRLTAPQLTRQIIQGGGNMPAYGKNLDPAQVEALVAYMVTLRPEGVPPARDSAKPAVPGSEVKTTTTAADAAANDHG